MAAAADLARDGGEVILPAGPASQAGTLAVPGGARALVVFAHGGGSGRFNPRNRRVAAWLRQAGLGTLLMDLLTSQPRAASRSWSSAARKRPSGRQSSTCAAWMTRNIGVAASLRGTPAARSTAGVLLRDRPQTEPRARHRSGRRARGLPRSEG
jgi:putative phosphoribosyl transferase